MNKIDERRYEINNRKQEIRSLLEGNEEVNLDELEKELKALDVELGDLEKRSVIVERDLKTITKPEGDLITMNEKFDKETVRGTEEYRSAFYKTLQGKALTEVEQRAYSTSTVSGAIPTTTANMLIKKMKAIAPLLSEMTLFNIAGNITVNVEGTNSDASIAGENVALIDSGDTLVPVALNGYDVTKLIQISAAAATLAVSALEEWITDSLADSLTKKLEYFSISGTGSSQPKGVLNATYTAGTNLLALTVAPALTDLYTFTGMLPAGYDAGAKMLMSKKTLYTYFMVFRDDSTFPALNYVDGKFYVLGYEVMLSDNIATGTVVLGNFKKLVGNLSQDIKVEVEYSAKARQYNYVASAGFDCKPAIDEAFVKMTITVA
jgi:Predicted phage phi-C31 gp36 major capsid-like protein